MKRNPELKLHFIDVKHGDATIIEFPDYDDRGTAHFAVADFGAKLKEDRVIITEYLKALIDLRKDNDPNFDYAIEFACVTHPHDDHYGGLNRFLDEFASTTNPKKNKIRNFWDCGFRTTSTNYNIALNKIIQNNNLTFVRVAAGSEFEFGDTRITVLAPSVDLRNRFDTYGIGKNDASIVLKIKYKNSYIILAGDAEYASWGKTTEEFPRRQRINFYKDAIGLAERDETSDQLKCDLLRISHHGSRHGTSLEYLERLKPNRIVISAGSKKWYMKNIPNWVGLFPHQLVQNIFDVLDPKIEKNITGVEGNIIYKYHGWWGPRDKVFIGVRPDDPSFRSELDICWD